ncbi:MAG: hypothetical protein V3T05_11005, partial [Myxococcota bacterium]
VFQKELDKQGLSGQERAMAEARWNSFIIHGKEIFDSKEWKIAEDGLKRVGKGVVFGLLDTASLAKNVVDGVVEGAAGIVVGGFKGAVYLVGKGLGYVLEYVGAGLEWAGGAVSAGGNQIEERVDGIYSSSPEARAIEPRTQATFGG